MEISEKKDAEECKYEIPKSWIQFRGLSKELRKFPIIWAIGSILGVTQNVDMKFTKANGRPRIRVAVLNPDLIPKFIDVVIGDYVYELQFRVEEGGENAVPSLLDMDSQPEDDGTGTKERNSNEEEQQGNKEVNTPKGSTVSSVPNSGPKSTVVGASVAKLTTVIISSTADRLSLSTPQDWRGLKPGLHQLSVLKQITLLPMLLL